MDTQQGVYHYKVKNPYVQEYNTELRAGVLIDGKGYLGILNAGVNLVLIREDLLQQETIIAHETVSIKGVMAGWVVSSELPVSTMKVS